VRYGAFCLLLDFDLILPAPLKIGVKITSDDQSLIDSGESLFDWLGCPLTFPSSSQQANHLRNAYARMLGSTIPNSRLKRSCAPTEGSDNDWEYDLRYVESDG
jgi:hypothetical protein